MQLVRIVTPLVDLMLFSIFTFENSNARIEVAQDIIPLKIPHEIYKSLGWLSNFALRYFKYLILTQIHSHIFNLAH